MPGSQAGRRGFESRLPLHVFNNLRRTHREIVTAFTALGLKNCKLHQEFFPKVQYLKNQIDVLGSEVTPLAAGLALRCNQRERRVAVRGALADCQIVES